MKGVACISASIFCAAHGGTYADCEGSRVILPWLSAYGPIAYEVLSGVLAELFCIGASLGSKKSLFFQLLCPCKSSQGFASGRAPGQLLQIN